MKVGRDMVIRVVVMMACLGLAVASPSFAQGGVAAPGQRAGAVVSPRIGQAIPAERVPAMPSAKFARYMLGHPAVIELEPGVIAANVPQFDHPAAILAIGDGFEAFALCAKRVTVGCDVTFFDFAAQEISRYHMPLELAQKRETYKHMLAN